MTLNKTYKKLKSFYSAKGIDNEKLRECVVQGCL